MNVQRTVVVVRTTTTTERQCHVTAHAKMRRRHGNVAARAVCVTATVRRTTTISNNKVTTAKVGVVRHMAHSKLESARWGGGGGVG